MNQVAKMYVLIVSTLILIQFFYPITALFDIALVSLYINLAKDLFWILGSLNFFGAIAVIALIIKENRYGYLIFACLMFVYCLLLASYFYSRLEVYNGNGIRLFLGELEMSTSFIASIIAFSFSWMLFVRNKS